jgi:predicted RNase H-like HicB family nuclease/uncharacterized damage-inducible protein DinB
MRRYCAYLESDDSGRCMAHVLDLPGCFVRASGRDAALDMVPSAIRDYHAWLCRHGEPAPPEGEPFEIEVAEEIGGTGPFDPGDAAARSRADLLALVRGLPDEVLDWQADPDSLSIRRLLRHVGNAEEWYVSRVVSPEALPPEWQHDEDLPIFEFLEMERRTALESLEWLTEAERSEVFHPTHWTEHPEEPWTARKVLRRFLEHEREHTAQARELLAGSASPR